MPGTSILADSGDSPLRSPARDGLSEILAPIFSLGSPFERRNTTGPALALVCIGRKKPV